MNLRSAFTVLALTGACSTSSEIDADGSITGDTGASPDAPIDAPACATDGSVYLATGTGTSLDIIRSTGIATLGMDVADVTCPSAVTAIGALSDGSMFAALKGGSIARVTLTTCTAITVTPALTGDVALVGVGTQLLALERSGGGLWRIDPASGAATRLSTIAGVTASTSLVGGEQGAHVYIPAPLIGEGSLIPLDAGGQPRTSVAISGASSTQASADWVAVVADDSKLWMSACGYYGAGGARRTMLMPVVDNSVTYAAYEYYAPTIAITAPTCP